MPNVEKLSIALTPEMASLVREVVEAGEYASSSEVVREALRDWKRKRSLDRQQLDGVRRLWDEGLKSGPGRLEHLEAIKADARRRLQKEKRVE